MNISYSKCFVLLASDYLFFNGCRSRSKRLAVVARTQWQRYHRKSKSAYPMECAEKRRLEDASCPAEAMPRRQWSVTRFCWQPQIKRRKHNRCWRWIVPRVKSFGRPSCTREIWAPQVHPKNTYASQTVVSDGSSAFVVFSNGGKIWTTALDLNGKKLWQKPTATYTSNRPFGFGTSPTFADGKLFVTCVSNGDSFVLALNPTDGQEIYRIQQPKATSYSVPVVATVAGKRQLLMYGGQQVAGYDPETGVQLWKTPAPWVTTCGTMVWDGDLVFASGGFPPQQTMAIRADGSGQIVWQNPVKVYEQSMIVVDGYLYALAEKGIVYCWRCADGKEMWSVRARGPESASPVYAGGNLYFTNELGTTFVVKPDPNEFKLVATNQLGSSSFASMTMLDNRIYTRVADANQQEWLYCLGKE